MANTPEAEVQEEQIGEQQQGEEMEEEVKTYVPLNVLRGFISPKLKKISGKMMIYLPSN